MRDYRLYLQDILAAIESIEQFVAGMDLDQFQNDDKTAQNDLPVTKTRIKKILKENIESI